MHVAAAPCQVERLPVMCRGPKPPRARGGEDASLQLFVTMFQDEVKVYRDVSGRSMHRRGYRGVVHRAALNESAAAGVLLMAGWPAIAAQGVLPSTSWTTDMAP